MVGREGCLGEGATESYWIGGYRFATVGTESYRVLNIMKQVRI